MENKWRVVIGLMLAILITAGFIGLYLYCIYEIKLSEEPEDEVSEVKLNIPELNSIVYFKCNLTEGSKSYFRENDLINCYFWYTSNKNKYIKLYILQNKIYSPSRLRFTFAGKESGADNNYEENGKTLWGFNESERYRLVCNSPDCTDDEFTRLNEPGDYDYYISIKDENRTIIDSKYEFRVYSLEQLDNIKMTSKQVNATANATLLAAIISAWAVAMVAILQFSIILTNKNEKNYNKEEKPNSILK